MIPSLQNRSRSSAAEFWLESYKGARMRWKGKDFPFLLFLDEWVET